MQRKDIAKTVFRNSIYNIGAQVVNNIVYFFIVVIIARSLSETDFGKYATAKAFTALFVAFCSFGMDFLIIRDISRDARNAPQYLKNSLVLKAVMSLAVFILILTSTSFMNYSRDTTVAIYIFTCVNILGALCTTFDSIFKALQKMFFTSLNVIISGCILLFLVVICSLRHGSIIAYASLSFVSITFSIIFMALLVRYYLKIKPGAFSFKLCKYLFIESIPFGLANVFVLVLLQADTVMLSKMTSETVVGNYNVAYKIIFALMFFHTAYMISIYPVISKSFKDSKENLVISYEKTVKYFIMYGLFVAIFVTFRAHDIMYLLYGNKYKLGVTALQCLIWSYPFILLSTITAVTLNSINKTRVNTVFAALGAILNISLNLILIPKYSLIGAGAATIVTEIFIFVGAYSILSKHLIKINFLKISYKVIIASIALFLLLFAISSVNLFMAFFISLFMYLLVLIVFKYFTKGEYAIVKSFFIKDIGQTL